MVVPRGMGDGGASVKPWMAALLLMVAAIGVPRGAEAQAPPKVARVGYLWSLSPYWLEYAGTSVTGVLGFRG
jgi:hypothetical protein